jgi:uncharacterized membrane protein YfcA
VNHADDGLVSSTIWIEVALIGVGVGFLSGLFGKGGSAMATPMLAAIGLPPVVALAAPLPAAVPSTLASLRAYAPGHFVDRAVIGWSLAFGVPATLLGAVATRWVGGGVLVLATDVLIAALGVRFVVRPTARPAVAELGPPAPQPVIGIAAVAIAVGLVSGLLANSGGFLLAPLYLTILRLPIKKAFASSLAVAAVLAVPGTIVHAALGHIDWRVVLVLAATSVPLAHTGARLAVRIRPERLERIYGVALAVLGVSFLIAGS